MQTYASKLLEGSKDSKITRGPKAGIKSLKPKTTGGAMKIASKKTTKGY